VNCQGNNEQKEEKNQHDAGTKTDMKTSGTE
jgi:hypothetical protein